MKRSFSLILGFLTPLLFLNAETCLSAEEIILPEGTRITVQLNDNLSTRSNSEGDAFTAVVTMPVYSGDRIVIPKGSIVNGGISRILRPGRFKGKAVMNLLFQSIDIPGRGQAPIMAVLVGVDPDDGAEGGRAQGSSETKEYGGSEAPKSMASGHSGAGIPAKSGAAKGAASGGETGVTIVQATMFSSPGNELEIHRGSVLDIALTRPLTIPSSE